MRRQLADLEAEVALRAARRQACADDALRQKREQARRHRTDAMALAHRERQRAVSALSLREQRQLLDRRLSDADERRRVFHARFLARGRWTLDEPW